jgi:curved DNA-binding protein CbpA
MTAINSLDLKGSIGAYAIAETMLEIKTGGLSGSLRLEHGEKKVIVYFHEGRAVYAVSNQRTFRLSEVLLARELIDKSFVMKHSAIKNDLQFAEATCSESKISANEARSLIGELCEAVIKDSFEWQEGEWTFSPNVRLKAGLSYSIDLDRLLMEHARAMSVEAVAMRLANAGEYFGLNELAAQTDLEPQEAFLISRLDSGKLTLGHLLIVSGQSRNEALKSIYVLWMSGALSRSGWKSVFSEEKIRALRSATFEPKKMTETAPSAIRPKREIPVKSAEPGDDEELPDQADISLDEALTRIESAWNYYLVLGIEPSAKMGIIRKSYVRLAKLLHPDRYRSESPEQLRRIEKAFTEVAQAHETLKTHDGRQSYDIRLRELERDRAQASTPGAGSSRQEDQAAAEFERGFALQLNGDLEAAVPHLARAVHYSPNIGRYHAYYGKALSADESQRHKAQSELLAAIQLEPQNAAFRLLLAEFYIRYKLLKRAEGELTRLLETSPNNREAITLLDSLRAKSLN